MLLCREILAKFLPHVAHDSQQTYILPFYSFAAVQRPVSGAAMPTLRQAKPGATVAADEPFMQPIADAQ